MRRMTSRLGTTEPSMLKPEAAGGPASSELTPLWPPPPHAAAASAVYSSKSCCCPARGCRKGLAAAAAVAAATAAALVVVGVVDDGGAAACAAPARSGHSSRGGWCARPSQPVCAPPRTRVIAGLLRCADTL
jgi:hypothetical protein